MQRIFVGDVQGCVEELDALLARARRTHGDDFSLWCVGDLVNRGPESLRVLERVRGLVDAGRARMVLGNHELALLQVYFGLRRLVPRDTLRNVLDAPDIESWIEWLRRQPVAVCDAIAGQPFVMVHASVHPRWSLAQVSQQAQRIHQRLGGTSQAECKQLLAAFLEPDRAGDPDAEALARMTRCRMAEGDRWSSQEPATPGQAWHRAWSAENHGYGVVYGHWARQRLHVADGLRGLDTGCVHHGRGADGMLTAWLAPEGGRPDGTPVFAAPDDRFWHEPARRAYYTEP